MAALLQGNGYEVVKQSCVYIYAKHGIMNNGGILLLWQVSEKSWTPLET